MNWQAKGKGPGGGKKGTLNLIGGPDTEDAARAAFQSSHPKFVIEGITPLDAAQPAAAEPAKEPPKRQPHPQP